MLWKLRKKPIIISSELHEKLTRTSKKIEQVPSEVVSVRILCAQDDNNTQKPELTSCQTKGSSKKSDGETGVEKSDGLGSYSTYR